MKRNNRNIKLRIDFIPFINELIKFLNDDQYLKNDDFEVNFNKVLNQKKSFE